MAVKTPAITASAHPVVITIQPPPSAFERLSSTAATTPSPSKIRIRVPRNSPSSGEVMSGTSLGFHPVERASYRFLPLLIEPLTLRLSKMRLPRTVHGPRGAQFFQA